MGHKKYRPRTDLKSVEEAWEILEPLSAPMSGWLQESWDWVQDLLDGPAADESSTEPRERRAVFDGSTVAAMVYNRFAFVMRRGLAGQDGVVFVQQGRMVRALFDGDIILGFKKLDKKLLSSNIGTGNQDLIYSQQFQLNGIPRPTNVTFGYFTDPLGIKLLGVYFTCPKGYRKNHWSIRVGGYDDGGNMLFDPRVIDGGPSGPLVGKKKAERAS